MTTTRQYTITTEGKEPPIFLNARIHTALLGQLFGSVIPPTDTAQNPNKDGSSDYYFEVLHRSEKTIRRSNDRFFRIGALKPEINQLELIITSDPASLREFNRQIYGIRGLTVSNAREVTKATLTSYASTGQKNKVLAYAESMEAVLAEYGQAISGTVKNWESNAKTELPYNCTCRFTGVPAEIIRLSEKNNSIQLAFNVYKYSYEIDFE